MSHALIIEDELLLAFSIEEALRELGYLTFDIVTSVRDAVAAAERQCPDLLIANHQIVDGTGTDSVLAICAEKPIPVVFATGSGPDVRKRVPEALIVDKPFTLPRLSAAVGDAVARPFRYSPDSNGLAPH